MFRSNPMVRRMSSYSLDGDEKAASFKGIAIKSIILVVIVIASALLSYVWFYSAATGESSATAYGIAYAVCAIAAILSVMLASFIPPVAGVFGIVYAVAEGFLLGLTSTLFEVAYSGIVLCALLGTAVTFGVMAFLYLSKAVRVTSKFRRFVFVALISVVITQLLMLLLSLFGVGGTMFAFYFNSFWLQLGACALMILLACFMLLIDFDNIANTVNNGLPKRFEWVSALGLLISLIWLYLQFLRLFALLFSRRN
ncbi:MAG: Bax inhibitor-1/YccA family protein [Clostridia bacterium]|nr:Bax inhibitor-1/YccA family protein [Clostridia bacterium]